MAFARDKYTATASQADFTITFSYLDEDDILVYSNGVLNTVTTDYTLPDATTVRFGVAKSSGVIVIIQRASSQITRLVDYTAGALSEADLDNDSLQAFYMAQEAIDIAGTALGLNTIDEWDAETLLIHNVVDPVVDQDAATKKYVDDTTTDAAIGTLAVPISIANGGTAAASAATAFGNIKQAASTTATGVVELATTAESVTGTDTARAITPAGLHGALAGLTDTTITASDTIIFADATDSQALKEDTVQGILDLAAGAIRQVKVFTDFAETTTTSTSFVDASGRSVSFTPTATDSIIHIGYQDQFGGELGTVHGIVEIGISRGAYSAGVLLAELNVTRNDNGSNNLHFRYAGYMQAWDTPSTTSAVTYNIYWQVESGTTARLACGTFTRTGTTSTNNMGNHIVITEYSPDVATMPTYTD
jgi:hypothetical protein